MNTISLVNLVEQHTDELYSWALYKVSDTELAKDLVQDTFVAAAEKLDSFKGKSSPKTWLFSILNNKITDWYRKKVKQAVVMEKNDPGEFFDSEEGWLESKQPKNWPEEESHLLDDSDFQEVLNKCLGGLPEKWNLSIKLKYLSEKSGEEICQDLGITPSNFWQIIHRAKLQLRECVEYNWFKI
ncbi:MAG: sigma-70 family RNA polymerase sigma factor [Bacteroidales bacterium]|nr:sigma-70 family RNA polymerase sigma factor [Bacteroidales bacterium]